MMNFIYIWKQRVYKETKSLETFIRDTLCYVVKLKSYIVRGDFQRRSRAGNKEANKPNLIHPVPFKTWASQFKRITRQIDKNRMLYMAPDTKMSKVSKIRLCYAQRP